MTIQPLSNRSREISVTEAIEPAYDRVKRMLFQPFDLAKWIIIGFCAWLAGLGESAAAAATAVSTATTANGSGAQPAEQLRHFYHQARDYVLANLAWIVPRGGLSGAPASGHLAARASGSAAAASSCSSIVWPGTKPRWMLPWHQYAAAGQQPVPVPRRSWACWAGLIPADAGNCGLSIIKMVLQGEPDVPGIMLVVGLVHAHGAAGHRVRAYPQIHHGFCGAHSCFCAAAPAWRPGGEFWKLLAANPGKFTVYILFPNRARHGHRRHRHGGNHRDLLHRVLSAGVLPFVGTVLLLPVLLFKRAYSLYYLAQYGPQYDVFPQPAAPPAGPLPPEPAHPAAGPGRA